MNKRSKVLFVILIFFVILTLLSMGQERVVVENKPLKDFEEEIIKPENDLDPLNEKLNNNVVLIDVALKTEGIIENVFNFLLNFFKNIIDKII